MTRGLTLLELLVVIGIISALMSMGIGGYLALRRGAEFDATWSRVESVVRRAHNHTLEETAPAGVFIEDVTRAELRRPAQFIEGEVLEDKDDVITIDVRGQPKPVEIPKDRLVRIVRVTRVRAVGFDTVGAWHLEQSDESFGSFDRGLTIKGGARVYGKIGGAVLLNDGVEGERMVAGPAPDDSRDPFRLPKGGRIEMWVYALPGGRADGYLAMRKGSYVLKVTADGVVAGGPPNELAEAQGYVLPLNRWAKVALEFSADHVAVSVDDVVRGGFAREDADLSPPPKEDLVFGEGFVGVIDEIRVQRRAEVSGFDLPGGFELKGPDVTVFRRGRLDSAYHSAPVTFELVSGETRAAMTVCMSGRIEK